MIVITIYGNPVILQVCFIFGSSDLLLLYKDTRHIRADNRQIKSDERNKIFSL